LEHQLAAVYAENGSVASRLPPLRAHTPRGFHLGTHGRAPVGDGRLGEDDVVHAALVDRRGRAKLEARRLVCQAFVYSSDIFVSCLLASLLHPGGDVGEQVANRPLVDHRTADALCNLHSLLLAKISRRRFLLHRFQ